MSDVPVRSSLLLLQRAEPVWIAIRRVHADLCGKTF